MGQTIMLTGMVLAAIPIGEYDKRITILTKERGKISVFARGARKLGNQQLAAAGPFAFGEFEVFEGRNSYSVKKVSISNYFRELTSDFEGVHYGFYFLEMADYYTRENLEALHILKLLYQSLKALEKEALSNRLVRCVFELKSLYYNGEYPNVFSCMNCQSEENLGWFDARKGGVICESCKNTEQVVFKIDGSTLYAMQYIITSSIEKLYTFTLTEPALQNLEKIIKEYMRIYVDRKFKSLQILEENKEFSRFLQE